MPTLADRLAELFAEQPEKRPTDLARAVGIKQPSVSSWMSGATKQLEATNAMRAAAFFGVHTWWLVTGEGSKYLKSGELNQHREPPATTAGWPFFARESEYERLAVADKKALNRVVSAFIAGASKSP